MFPKLIQFGDLFLPTYGVLVAAAFLTALWVTSKLGRRVGLDRENLLNLGIYCALAGMLGAKLTMFLFDFEYYARNPGEILSRATLQAAGVFQGGVMLAVLVAYFYMKNKGMPGLTTSDVFAPGLALGHAIGRIGCLAAGCCWGIECDRPWAVTFKNPDAHNLVNVPLNVPLHPTQLYESAAELGIFAALYWYFGRPHGAGRVIGLYLVLSSVARLGIEFYRFHEQALPFGLPLSITQWLAIGLLVAGVVLMVRKDVPRVVPAPAS